MFRPQGLLKISSRSFGCSLWRSTFAFERFSRDSQFDNPFRLGSEVCIWILPEPSQQKGRPQQHVPSVDCAPTSAAATPANSAAVSRVACSLVITHGKRAVSANLLRSRCSSTLVLHRQFMDKKATQGDSAFGAVVVVKGGVFLFALMLALHSFRI